MKKTATISAILAVVGFMAVYVALCYLVPGWRLKLHATAWVYFAASLRHMALLKGVLPWRRGWYWRRSRSWGCCVSRCRRNKTEKAGGQSRWWGLPF